MNSKKWEKSHAKRLFDLFMELEKSSYPEYHHEKLDERHKIAERFIIEFGVNHVTVKNYTNMMQLSSAVILDCYDSERCMEGDLELNLGSEPHEIWAKRFSREDSEKFNFLLWKWEEDKETGAYI